MPNTCNFYAQKQLSKGVLRKRFSENTQQIYVRIPMLKCDFKKVRHVCFLVNLLQIFRTPFSSNTSLEGCFSTLNLKQESIIFIFCSKNREFVINTIGCFLLPFCCFLLTQNYFRSSHRKCSI